ncbi:hypothetical protein GCM10009081_32870 [Brevundimonas nasdae]
MFKNTKRVPIQRHSVSIKLLGMSIDGNGIGGVVVVPLVLLIICFAGVTLGNGAAWLARLFTQSNVISESAPATTGPKD